MNGRQPFERDRWPKRLAQIFPGVDIDDDLDALLYDDTLGQYLLFRGSEYWKFKASAMSELEPNLLFPGYPRSVMKDFALDNTESGFFVKLNYRRTNSFSVMYLLSDSKIIVYKDRVPIGAYFLPFNLSQIEFAINENAESFLVLKERRLYNFKINYKTRQVTLLSIDSNIKDAFL